MTRHHQPKKAPKEIVAAMQKKPRSALALKYDAGNPYNKPVSLKSLIDRRR